MYNQRFTMKEKAMYYIVGIDSGVIMARFGFLKNAKQWMSVNNYDDEGNPLNFYKIVKDSYVA